MNLLAAFKREMELEANTTRAFLKLVQPEHFDFQVHEKSYKLLILARHIAEVNSWMDMILNQDELDFETSTYQPATIKDNAQLLEYFEQNLKAGLACLEAAGDVDLMKPWTMRSGSMVFFSKPKWEAVRETLSQTVHHRAQLGVNFRLLGIPLPASYGPTADQV